MLRVMTYNILNGGVGREGRLAMEVGFVPRWVLNRVQAAGFTDCFRALHPDDEGFTLPPPAPNARLDYLFANPVLAPALRSCSVVREPPVVLHASDHYPVVAEFDL